MRLENFVAIDFETANQYRSSACSIGIIVVENSEIIQQESFFIKPDPMFFNYHNIAVHGITPDMVADALTFEELWSRELAPFFIKADALVAHNASFDMSVLKACLNNAEIAFQLPDHYCTVKLSRQKLPNLIDHKLNTVSKHFGILLNHHEALSDARAAAKIMLKLNEL